MLLLFSRAALLPAYFRDSGGVSCSFVLVDDF